MNAEARASVAMVFMLLIAPGSEAEIVGVELFEYPDAALDSQGGGFHWDWDNTNGGGHTLSASDWDVQFGAPVIRDGQLVTSGGSACLREYNGPDETGADEVLAAINEDGGRSADVVFFRVEMTREPGVTWSGVSSFDFDTERVFFGVPSTGTLEFGIHQHGSGITLSGERVEAGRTYTLVGKLDFGNDLLTLWVDPDLAQGETRSPRVTREYPDGFWSTAVRLGSGGSGMTYWNNLVVATRWDDLGTVVTTTRDEDNGSLLPQLGDGVSLREAVNHAPPGSLVTFSNAINGRAINLRGDLLRIRQLAIDASDISGGMTVNAGGGRRAFWVNNGGSAFFEALQITGAGRTNRGPGGAIQAIESSSVSLRGCTLCGNTATSGGAVFVDSSSSVVLFDSTVDGNTASADGGGIFCQSSGAVRLDGSTVSNNSAAGRGGGIYSASLSTVTLIESSVSGNSCELDGGGVFNRGRLFHLDRSTLSGNAAGGSGGAMHNLSIALVTLSTVAGNTAQSGGGFFNEPIGDLQLIQATVSANRAASTGGGIDHLGVAGRLSLRQSVVAGNQAVSGRDIRGAFSQPVTPNVIGGNPWLAPLADYGGGTLTMLPVPGSPAINAASSPITAFDQRGYPRAPPGDIGAVEFVGRPDLALVWSADFDGDGRPFGSEHALGLNPFLADYGSPLLPRVGIDAAGRPQITIGRNDAARQNTIWVVKRTGDFVRFTEIYRLNGPAATTTTAAGILVEETESHTILTDSLAPSPIGFYVFEALLAP